MLIFLFKGYTTIIDEDKGNGDVFLSPIEIAGLRLPHQMSPSPAIFMKNLITLLNKYINLSNEWNEKKYFNEFGKLNKINSLKWKEAEKREREYNSLVIAIADKLGKDTYVRKLE